MMASAKPSTSRCEDEETASTSQLKEIKLLNKDNLNIKTKIHLLSFKIEYDGEAQVQSYFNTSILPTESEEGLLILFKNKRRSI